MTDDPREYRTSRPTPFDFKALPALNVVGSYLEPADWARLTETDKRAKEGLTAWNRYFVHGKRLQQESDRIDRLLSDTAGDADRRGFRPLFLEARKAKVGEEIRGLTRRPKTLPGEVVHKLKTQKQSFLYGTVFPQGLVELPDDVDVDPRTRLRFRREQDTLMLSVPLAAFPGAYTEPGRRGDIKTAWVPAVLPEMRLEELRRPAVLRDLRHRVFHENLEAMLPLIEETARVLRSGRRITKDPRVSYDEGMTSWRFIGVVMFVMIVLPYMPLPADDLIHSLLALPPFTGRYEQFRGLATRMAADLIRYAQGVDVRTAWVTAVVTGPFRGLSLPPSHEDFVADDDE